MLGAFPLSSVPLGGALVLPTGGSVEIDALTTAQEVRDYPVTNAKAVELQPTLGTWLN